MIPTASDTDSYGIAAQLIGGMSVGGVSVPLKAGASNDTFANGKQQQLPSGTGDEFVYEV